jgi:hypothetical protein
MIATVTRAGPGPALGCSGRNQPDPLHRVRPEAAGPRAPFRLLPWQRFVIGSLNGWLTAHGSRRFRKDMWDEQTDPPTRTVLDAVLREVRLPAVYPSALDRPWQATLG